MTTLVFNFTAGEKKWTIATDSWVVAENSAVKCSIHGHGLAGDDVIIYATMDEFLALIAEGGKIVDLRKLQEEK